MSRHAEQRAFWISWFCALALTLIPLPGEWAQVKPFWFGMLAVYWALEAPERISLRFAFAAGLLLDLSQGLLLGENALRLTILVYITSRFRFRLRFFPIGQQTAAVLALMLNDRVLSLWIRLLGGFGWPSAGFWIAPLLAAFLWPILFVLLDQLQRRER